MSMELRQEGEFAILRIDGSLVRENQADFRALIEGSAKSGVRGVALDFRQLEYLDSSGLGTCAAVQKSLKKDGCGGLVVFGAAPNVLRMWKMIRLDLVIPCFETEKAALESFESAGSDETAPSKVESPESIG